MGIDFHALKSFNMANITRKAFKKIHKDIFFMRYFLLVLFFASGFYSCSSKPKTHAKALPTIVVSLSPYDTFVKAIAADTIIIKTAVPSNVNAHVFEPSPQHLAGFEQADLFFGIEEPFEKKLCDTLRSFNSKLIYVNLGESAAVKPLPSSGGCSHHSHHREEVDKHYWTDPLIVIHQSEQILKTLTMAFPEHKELYEKNFFILKQKLLSLDNQLHERLSPIHGSVFISSHPSLGYFCSRYHLEELSIECEGKTPLPKDIQKILTRAKKSPILCVFGYQQFDNKGATALSSELGIKLYIININDPDYFKEMEKIANYLTENSHEL